MENVCPICKSPYAGSTCLNCTGTGGDITPIDVQNTDAPGATAFLVDLVSNRKIPITTPRCKVGRDDLNDIVISGDQSISRFHFVITKENGQYNVQDGKSRHGTFLNGNQITGPEPIHDGDVLKVGVSLFWFVIEAQVVAPGSDKTSPVDMENEQALEFVPGDTPMPATVGAAASMPLDETIAPKPPEWVHQLESGSAPGDTGEPEAIAPTAEPLSKESSSESKFEITGAIPNAGLEARLESAAKAAAQTEEHAIAASAGESKSADSTSDVNAEAAPEPVAELAREDQAISSAADSESKDHETAEPAEQKDLATKSSESAADQDIIEPVSSEHSTEDLKSSENSESEAKQTEESVETVEPIEAPKDTSLEDSVTQSNQLEEPAAAAVVAEDNAEEPATKETAQQIESDFGTIDKQFSLSADEINQAANRIAESYANAQSGNSLKADESSEAEAAESKPQDTLEKLAEIVGEAKSEEQMPEPIQPSLSQYLNAPVVAEPASSERRSTKSTTEGRISPDKYLGELTGNGAKGMSIVKESASSATVPDWCKRYFSSELNHLDKELTELNEEVRQLQIKIKDVEGRTSLTKGLRNILLTTQGDDLVDACGKIFAMMGWRVRVSDDDKMELKMEADDKSVSIARVVWTEKEPDRSHLGQLSISQTRYWCEVGVEPKGILIIARGGDHSVLPQAGEYAHELADYASKKNVCLMSTLQLLSCYKEVFLHDGSPESVRSTIQATSGWLHGFHLEPGTSMEPGEKAESASTGKASLSSLLSA